MGGAIVSEAEVVGCALEMTDLGLIEVAELVSSFVLHNPYIVRLDKTFPAGHSLVRAIRECSSCYIKHAQTLNSDLIDGL